MTRLLALLGLLCALYAAPAYADEPDPATALTDALYTEAVVWLGTPYRWGGVGPYAFDCSGYILRVWRDATGGAVALPHYTDALVAVTVPVAPGERRFGDIVLWRFADPRQPRTRYPHAGLVFGPDTVIEATAGGVQVSPLGRWPNPEFRRPRQSPA
jgi:cell wall-associated NlpC family hydrolase